MATDNDKKLTRYTSAVTIVTADTMNKLYGGEFGFNETVGEFDPLVYGHVHDGKHQDGHASKIMLTSGAHVRGYLGNANLGGTNGTTPAVRYSNIFCYSEATFGSPAARRAAAAAGGYDLEILAIPEFVDNGVDRCYYLDLSNSAGGENGSIQFNESGAFGGNDDLVYNYSSLLLGLGTNAPARKLHIVGDAADPPIRVENMIPAPIPGAGTAIVIAPNGDLYTDASIGGAGAFETTANVTSNSPGDLATDDFVFGSDSLDDDGDVNHDFRMLFDKSRGAFRAGEETATNWDEPSRGSYSFAFGTSVSANAWNSITFGQDCSVSSLNSIVASGYENSISYSAYIGPEDFTGQGYGNGILTGTGNGISADEYVPGGLNPGTAGNGTVGAAIVGGINNGIGRFGAASIIGSGEGNGISLTVLGKPTPPGEAFASGIFSGWQNTIANNGDSDVSVILGGKSNYIDGSYSLIGGGEQNLIEESALSGLGSHNAIVGGRLNLINSSGSRNFIGGGGGTLASNANEINDPASDSVVVGGANNTLNSSYSGIVSGNSNQITDSERSLISGGENNQIIGGSGGINKNNSICGGGTNVIYADAGEIVESSFIGGADTSNIGNSSHSAIVGGRRNQVLSLGGYNFIGGGGGESGPDSNFIGDNAFPTTARVSQSFIGGGSANQINNDLINEVTHSSIVGGRNNTISIDGSFIGGGEDNDISVPFASFTSSRSVITGGSSNSITADGTENGILSGWTNAISAKSVRSSIVGGGSNSIADSDYSTVTGGASNSIADSAYSIIAGGEGSTINATGNYNAIISGGGGPGSGNAITLASSNSSIIGGFDNTILNGSASLIMGGSNNLAGGSYTTALGNAARATNYGQFSMASGTFSAAGDAQKSEVIWRGITNSTVLTEIFLDGAGQRFGIRNESTCAFKIIVVARNEAGSRQGTWEIFGAVQRSGGGGATFPGVSNPTVTTLFAAPSMSVAASVLGNDLILQVEDTAVEGGDTTAWVAHGRMVNVTY